MPTPDDGGKRTNRGQEIMATAAKMSFHGCPELQGAMY
jgi:hypothetical protein